ncbi:MAG: prepilin-type N-terminal cleavage/methylation domain-containing protein [Deltaproteobacteria bacterium]|nr:prepilin-type N-terminal cleavage/methylation domain-containing protein [Deltaproteobacteria bacterium]
MASARERNRRGFTLLEVMVAIMALGIAMTLLTRAAIDGMRLEGDAYRRLGASRVANQLLADLESGMISGVVPEIGQRELEVDGYVVVVEANPVEPADLGIDLDERDRDSGPLTALLGDDRQSTGPPLLEIQIVVRWQEGIYTQEVRRTTFSFDAASVASGLPSVEETDADDDEDFEP